MPTRTVNLQVNADLPSREGLTIASEISILYRMLPEAAPRVLGRGFEVEAVLLKTVRLPAGLASSIEERLRAEQDAERLRFVLAQEQREAERKLIEAKGVRDAQLTLAEGLTPEILKYRAIEALQKLYDSPNAKIIVTDGRGNLIVDAKSRSYSPHLVIIGSSAEAQ